MSPWHLCALTLRCPELTPSLCPSIPPFFCISVPVSVPPHSLQPLWEWLSPVLGPEPPHPCFPAPQNTCIPFQGINNISWKRIFVVTLEFAICIYRESGPLPVTP